MTGGGVAAGSRIAPAEGEADLADVSALFRAYAASLPVDLAFQNFEAELAGLPGRYAPPSGALLIARDADGAAIGCGAFRPLGRDGACEMKRLYVAPAGRGTGLGGRLVDALVEAAARAGHREIWLDTLPTMTDAMALYARRGFAPMPAYYDTPVAGTVFLRRRL